MQNNFNDDKIWTAAQPYGKAKKNQQMIAHRMPTNDVPAIRNGLKDQQMIAQDEQPNDIPAKRNGLKGQQMITQDVPTNDVPAIRDGLKGQQILAQGSTLGNRCRHTPHAL